MVERFADCGEGHFRSNPDALSRLLSERLAPAARWLAADSPQRSLDATELVPDTK